MSLTIREMVEEAGKCAKEKGWHDDPLNVGEQLQLIGCELAEAMEDYRNHEMPDGPKDLGFALKDLMFWGEAGDGPWSRQKTPQEIEAGLLEERDHPPEDLSKPPGTRMSPWPSPEREAEIRALYKPCGFASELADVVIRTAQLAWRMGIDLEQAIVEKQKYNRTREHRHGGKKV